jgi:predicted transcriptional regulator
MNRTLNIRIDEGLEDLLTRVAEQNGSSRSAVAREALRRHLRITLLDHVRERLAPFAAAHGLETDEDVFGEVS